MSRISPVLLLTAVFLPCAVSAQTPPAPPLPPLPAVRDTLPPVPPLPPSDVVDVNEQLQSARDLITPDVKRKIDSAMARAKEMQFEILDRWDTDGQFAFNYAPKLNLDFQIQTKIRRERDADRNVDSAYRNGTRAIDKRDYDRAIQLMDQVIQAKVARSDGAYYWKAYAQSRLGRTADALASLQSLRKEYGSSRWLNDAAALEVEVKQDAGQHVSPDSQSDEDLKLLAINSLMNTDPERAIPLLDKVLNSAKNGPRVRERALFVLARSDSPQARDTVIRVAKGNGNPDLQLKAVEFVGTFSNKESVATLGGIYRSSTDLPVKRAALEGLFIAKAHDELLNILRSETNPDLRRQAIQFVSQLGGTSEELAALYSAEKDAATKREIMNSFFAQGDAKQLIAVARRESDPELKRRAVELLTHMKSKDATDFMMELLNQ